MRKSVTQYIIVLTGTKLRHYKVSVKSGLAVDIHIVALLAHYTYPSQSNWNLEVLVSGEKGKPAYPVFLSKQVNLSPGIEPGPR